jgi:hypothetical protein
VVGAAAFSRADSASVALLRGITPRFTFGTQGAIDAFAGASAHGFGPRYSIAVMHPSASEADLRGLARDVLIWDGLGCLTPKWIFVPGSLPDATALARRMSPVLAEAAVLLPASASSRLDPAKAQWVGSAALQGFADAGAGWAVGAIPADTLVEPCPRAACFVALPDLASLPALLAPLGPRLQGIALPGAREPSTDAPASDTLRALPAPLRALLSLGLSYVAPPGRLQTPPLRWDHDDVRIQRACVR